MKVAVAMSGGLDSSLTAALLLEEGYEVRGITMRTWSRGEEYIEGARRVAQKLGIPLYVANYKKKFKEEVIKYFIEEYSSGRTPNPCIICNERMKFGSLLEKARSLGAEYLATGHYAKVEYSQRRKRYLLKKGVDKKKEQSYFLFSLSQEQLSHILMPLGDYLKSQVRKMAKKRGLEVYNKPESQELCFISEDDYSKLMRTKTGLVLNREGKVLGKHQGIHLFTIGQRRGLGIAAGKPLYVTAIDRKKNALIVGNDEEVFKNELVAEKVNWVTLRELKRSRRAQVKIRYIYPPAEALITPLTSRKVKVKFSQPQRAITPGQAAVFYEGDTLLGGGWIK